ncbi:glycosyltransferase involved in cell wall biosynthesis [Methanocalculus sp. AMF5]|uniref:glycosyltransferase family 4 protein n=1 Tax=Methanocalculus sp. AMF5 TaxID=1198257 RepID=UPI00209C9400|nr:glycosyltransferase family 4 protein [Methanocalculus sp. AMF5]MCP1663163.1 glycosyltransferase involved in cell wall biosynthesis [Methanocalculus sp. AMF5]
MEKKHEKTIRVLFPYVGDTIGGSHISSLTLIRALDREEFEPIVAVHEEGMLIPYLDDLGVHFVRPPGSKAIKTGSKQDMIRYIVSRALFLRKNQVDIVHTNDGRMHTIWGIAARLAGVRLIWHLRSTIHSNISKNPYKLIYFKLKTALPTKVLTVSEYSKSTFPDRLKNRSIVVMNPFETLSPQPERAQSRQVLINELQCSHNTKIVGFVSNLFERKRPQIFVQMAAEICDSGCNDIIFPIFGDKREPMTTITKNLIEKYDLKEKCILMGPRFPIEPYMAACDVLVAPAVREPFGRTLVESMLVGTPVTAADDGGHKEIIESGVTGLLVKPDDPHAFAEAVHYLLENPTASKRMSEAARDWARNNCSVEEHVYKVQQVYRDLVMSRK